MKQLIDKKTNTVIEKSVIIIEYRKIDEADNTVSQEAARRGVCEVSSVGKIRVKISDCHQGGRGLNFRRPSSQYHLWTGEL